MAKIEVKGTGFLRDALERSAESMRQRVTEAVANAARSTLTHPDLTARELEVLRELTADWVRPMDVGGRNGSDHSRVLASLTRKGVVERKRRAGHCRPSYLYRNPNYQPPPKTPRKRTNFDHCYRFTKILASYECAGVDQDPNDSRPCGKCGPCEANKFLQSRPGLSLSLLED